MHQPLLVTLEQQAQAPTLCEPKYDMATTLPPPAASMSGRADRQSAISE